MVLDALIAAWADGATGYPPPHFADTHVGETGRSRGWIPGQYFEQAYQLGRDFERPATGARQATAAA